MKDILLIDYHNQMMVAVFLKSHKVNIIDSGSGDTITLDQCTRCGSWQSEDEEMYCDPDGNGYCDSCSEFCEGCNQYFSTDDMVDGVNDNRCCTKCSKKIISVVWSTEEVFQQAKQMHYPLNISEQQAIEILQRVKKNHDCNDGICWEVIDSHINSYFNEK